MLEVFNRRYDVSATHIFPSQSGGARVEPIFKMLVFFVFFLYRDKECLGQKDLQTFLPEAAYIRLDYDLKDWLECKGTL